VDEHCNPVVSRRRFLAVTGAAGIAGLASPFGVSEAAGAVLEAEASAKKRHLVLGHDLSTLQQEEDVGRAYSDSGRVQPLEKIVKAHGASHVRLRLWVDPPIPYNDLPHVLSMAQRIKDAGLKVLLDIHYSDFWADPGNQTTPQRWQSQDLTTLTRTVHDYTASVLNALATQGTPPSIVQIGNEITSGMLWPQGKIYVDMSQRWDEFTTLLMAGIAGARAGSTAANMPKIMVHIDRGGDNAGSIYFYDHILAKGVTFDHIGLSYYPWWHGPLPVLQANLNDLANRYHKDIVVVETAYPWTLANGDTYPNIVNASTYLYTGRKPSPKEQTAFLHQIISFLRKTPGGHGLGVVYWEPGWIPGVSWKPGEGDAWDNLTLFDFKGRSLPSIDAYRSAAKSAILG
jgi:arabinogalactan endo-1,4-beta-galactosidase